MNFIYIMTIVGQHYLTQINFTVWDLWFS